VAKAELGPRFHEVKIAGDVVDTLKASFQEVIFSRSDFARGKLHDVDDAQVHASYGGGIIVDQSNDPVFAARLDNDLFVQLPLHPVSVPVVPFGVLDRDMTADPDRSQGMQSLLTLAFTPRVLEQPGPVCIAAFKDHIRNQLLKRRVILDEAPRPKRLVSSIQNGRKIPVNCWKKSREWA
jgi:hypothetical protein